MQQTIALQQEQTQRMQAEQRASGETEKHKILQNLLEELSKTSDSELPTKLKEKDRLISNEKELNKQLEKKLNDTILAAPTDKKALSQEISMLEYDLRPQRFDKQQYLSGLESRERALQDGQANSSIGG